MNTNMAMTKAEMKTELDKRQHEIEALQKDLESKTKLHQKKIELYQRGWDSANARGEERRRRVEVVENFSIQLVPVLLMRQIQLASLVQRQTNQTELIERVIEAVEAQSEAASSAVEAASSSVEAVSKTASLAEEAASSARDEAEALKSQNNRNMIIFIMLFVFYFSRL